MPRDGRWLVYAGCGVVVAALIAGGIRWRKSQAQMNEARIQAGAFAMAIQSYRNEYGERAERFLAGEGCDTDQPRGRQLVRTLFGKEPVGKEMLNPRQIAFLARVDEIDPRWLEMKETGIFLDPWGRGYYVLVVGEAITVASDGPDLRAGTGDDVMATAAW